MSPQIVSGRVTRGRQLGRTLGFPTANIFLEGVDAIPYGVHAARVSVAGHTYPSMVNVGVQPTVAEPATEGEAGCRTCTLEAHLFDFNGSLYGELVEVELLHFIREEQQFASVELLAEQIQRDKITILNYFKQCI